MTKKVYVQITQKIFAVIRYQIYTQIRTIIRSRPAGTTDKYITKNELKDILGSLDTLKVRRDVFNLYGLKNFKEGDLINAYTAFLIDDKLQPTIRNIKKSHERFLQGILACDVFPGLDKCDPLQSQDEDIIPDKFGPKWYEFEQANQPKPANKLSHLLQMASQAYSHADNDEQDAQSEGAGLSNQLAETEPELVAGENNLLF